MAAPGGCKQRKNNITKIDPPTAADAAVAISGIFNAQVTPITAEHICPPANGQGWASGLFGIKNRMIAEAPIEATIIGYSGPRANMRVIRAIKNIEQKQAIKDMVLPFKLRLTGSTVRKRKNFMLNLI